jgi:hypothetical protein
MKACAAGGEITRTTLKPLNDRDAAALVRLLAKIA